MYALYLVKLDAANFPKSGACFDQDATSRILQTAIDPVRTHHRRCCLANGRLRSRLSVSAQAQSALTPDAALNELMDGNKRYTSGKMTSFEHDLAILKQHTEEKQEPFAAVLSCADSRVPVELVFDQTIGHVFVTRVAGNVVTPEIIGSLEYGAAVLGNQGDSGDGALQLRRRQSRHAG